MKKSLNVTEAATNHIKKCLGKTDYNNIRVGIKPSGCSGFSYFIEYAQNNNPEDNIYEGDDFKIIIDPKSMIYIAGSTLDYVIDGLQGGLKFENPNVKDQCGCGESFTM